MEAEEFEEDELIQALVCDVKGAFPQLIKAYHSQLYNYVFSRVKNLQSAEDIMQESWVRVFQALNQYPEERRRRLKLRSWLFTIVRHEMFTHLGKKNKLVTLTIEDFDQETNEKVLGPEDIVDLRNQVEDVKAAIEGLPPMYRTVLSLRLIQELEYREIAELLEQPVNNIRTYVSRGLNLLRERLAANVN